MSNANPTNDELCIASITRISYINECQEYTLCPNVRYPGTVRFPGFFCCVERWNNVEKVILQEVMKEMKLSDRVILPLVGSAFQPGKAAEAIEKIKDKELAQIAQGEYYFFSAQAEKCVETVKDYLDHDDVMLRLSADMLYTFANLTLGNPQAAQCTREDVQQCLTRAMQMDAPVNVRAACLFAFYVISIFLHIPPEEGTPPLQQYIPYLPIGQRLFAVSLLAHEIYLRQDYAKAKGVVQGAFLMADGVYPISMIYLGCVQAMCQINLKEQEEAIQTVSQAWEWARFDKFMEPFIEYHGLLHGVLEVCIRKKESVMHLQAGIQMQNVRKSTKRICRIRIQMRRPRRQTILGKSRQGSGYRAIRPLRLRQTKKTCR